MTYKMLATSTFGAVLLLVTAFQMSNTEAQLIDRLMNMDSNPNSGAIQPTVNLSDSSNRNGDAMNQNFRRMWNNMMSVNVP